MCRIHRNIAGIDAVTGLIDAFLDPTTAWTLVSASEKAPAGILRLMKRIAANEPNEIDPLLKHQRFSRALCQAVHHGDIGVAKWLVSEYDVTGKIRQPLADAAARGQLEFVQWLVRHHASRLVWTRREIADLLEADNLETILWLFKHTGQFDGEHEVKLNLDDLLRTAAWVGDLDVVNWVHDQYQQYGVHLETEVVEDALYSAARRGHRAMMEFMREHSSCSFGQRCLEGSIAGGNLELAQWIQSQSNILRVQASCLREPAANGQADVIVWALDNLDLDGRSDLENAVSDAAGAGNVEILKRIYESIGDPNLIARSNPVTSAAMRGHLEVVQWLHAHRPDPISSSAIEYAIEHGHIEVVRWLCEHFPSIVSKQAFEWAAMHNQLDVVKWLDQLQPKCLDRCEHTVFMALELAVSRGHLEMVQWLLEHKYDDGSAYALDVAAANRRLDTVKWLHENQIGAATVRAMDNAAQMGHMAIIKWLHANRTEGCSAEALEMAVRSGRANAFKWLLDNKVEQFQLDSELMADAIRGGDLEIVITINQCCQNNIVVTLDQFDDAITYRHYEVFEWLVREYGDATPGLDVWLQEGMHADKFKPYARDVVDELLTQRRGANRV